MLKFSENVYKYIENMCTYLKQTDKIKTVFVMSTSPWKLISQYWFTTFILIYNPGQNT